MNESHAVGKFLAEYYETDPHGTQKYKRTGTLSLISCSLEWPPLMMTIVMNEQ
jgi:hypothetical protein